MPPDEGEGECLHCEINDLVREYIDGQEAVDIGDVTAKMAESLVDAILFAPGTDQGKLLAATISYLTRLFVERSIDDADKQDRPH